MNNSPFQLPASEIEFHPASYCDFVGRLFWWNGELYRGITRANVDFVRQLFKEGVVQGLIEKGVLVQTELTNLSVQDFGLVLKHRRVSFVSYCFEWSWEMFRDAALLVIDLQQELTRHGLTLKGPHPWNVLFEGSRPVYVDFGSIWRDGGNHTWSAYGEFRRFYVLPLQAMACGYGCIARRLLHDMFDGNIGRELLALTRQKSLRTVAMERARRWLLNATKRIPPHHRAVVKNVAEHLKIPRHRWKTGKPGMNTLDNIRCELSGINIPRDQPFLDQDCKDHVSHYSDSQDWTKKCTVIRKLLLELNPVSVLAIGKNLMAISKMAATLGKQVIALDMKEQVVSQLYHDARGLNLSILPILMDFCMPSQGSGVCDQEGSPATSRLKCEMVLALGLVHVLISERQLNLEQISAGLSAFSKRWLVVEFARQDDDAVRPWLTGEYSWYCLENFISALRPHFQSIRVVSFGTDSRTLVLCEKQLF